MPSEPYLQLRWNSPFSVPVPLDCTLDPVSMELLGNEIACSIRLCQGQLKHFYPDYRDYYYLPFEDTAIHRSVGEYVDRSARKKATAKTCYTKKEGLFLPQFGPLWEPSFKEDYKSSLTYAAYSDELLSQPQTASAYAKQLLGWLAGQPGK